jgi:hypothetical protein
MLSIMKKSRPACNCASLETYFWVLIIYIMLYFIWLFTMPFYSLFFSYLIYHNQSYQVWLGEWLAEAEELELIWARNLKNTINFCKIIKFTISIQCIFSIVTCFKVHTWYYILQNAPHFGQSTGLVVVSFEIGSEKQVEWVLYSVFYRQIIESYLQVKLTSHFDLRVWVMILSQKNQ